MARAKYSGSESYFLSDACSFEPTHNFQQQFRKYVMAEPAIRGKVLDIGCGVDIPPFLADFCTACTSMDGVDPDPVIAQNPRLTRRWNAPLNQADIPAAEYDLAFAYNVVEHVSDPQLFFTHIRRILKPGGVFWALTPHSRHMFTWLARGAELARLKPMFHRHDSGVNTYSSYYRANSRRQVLRAIEGLGFREASFHYFPGGWGQYFPRGLAWVAKVYDGIWGYRRPDRMLITAYRLQVEEV